MKTTAQYNFFIGTLCLALAISGRAQSMFFRVVSTNATSILSLDPSGMLTWSNSVPGAVCSIESASSLSGGWSTYADSIYATGAVASIQLPLDATNPVAPSKYLFEVSYVNSAWGHVYYGIFVDYHGFVYSYNATPPSFSDPTTNLYYPAPYAVSFLDMKTAQNRAYVGTESRTNLEAMLALVSAAGQGQISPPAFVGADQGLETVKAFVYNPQRTNYSVILLRQFGDARITNSAPEAAALTQWLTNWWANAGLFSLSN